MTMQTFVTIHDQDLVLAIEADRGRFAGLDTTYLFVGPRPVDRILHLGERLVVAREYPGNIERWPHLYDFTGWWVLADYGIIRSDTVLMLQYDMAAGVLDLEAQIAAALAPPPAPPVPPELLGASIVLPLAPSMVAFACGHRSAGNWMLMLDGFEPVFTAGLAARDAAPPPPDFEEWPTTQGTAWRTSAFVSFMRWVRPILDVWAPDMWAGHHAERSVYAWLRHTGRTWAHLPGVVLHEHRDCHGTCALMNGQADVHAQRAASFGV